MEDEGTAVLVGQLLPVTQALNQLFVSRHLQLVVVEEAGGEGEEGWVGAGVLHQLGHLYEGVSQLSAIIYTHIV